MGHWEVLAKQHLLFLVFPLIFNCRLFSKCQFLGHFFEARSFGFSVGQLLVGRWGEHPISSSSLHTRIPKSKFGT